MDYLDFFKKLEEEKIDYLIVGGLALIIYGSPRFTYDIDLVILLEEENILKLLNVLTQFGYKVKIPVNPFDFAKSEIREEWIKNKNMKAMNFYNDNNKMPEVDIVIEGVDFDKLKKKKKTIKVKDVLLSVVSITDLIEMKKKAGRKIDLEDIEYLEIIMGNNV